MVEKHVFRKRFFCVFLLLLTFCLPAAVFSLGSEKSNATRFSDIVMRLASDISQSAECLKNEQGSKKADILKLSVFQEEFSLTELKEYLETINSSESLHTSIAALHSLLDEKSNLPVSLAILKAVILMEEKTRFLMAENPEDRELRSAFRQLQVLKNRAESISKSKELNDKETGSSGTSLRTSLNRQDSNSNQVSKGGSASSKSARLGAIVSGGKTTFSLWAPKATDVKLILFDGVNDSQGTVTPMKKDSLGIWSVVFDENLTGKYYKYSVAGPSGNGYLFNPSHLVNDPYAFANVESAGKSIVVDMSYTWHDQDFRRPAMKDLIIYEMHVKDYTAHPSSGVTDPSRIGKYLGLLQGGNTDRVLGHLKDLGVNAIELLPVHEFDNRAAPSGVNHWGYMTSHFFAPEGSYATAPAKGTQVKEFKMLVDGLHRAGFAVILDVVYNHSAEGNEKGPVYNLKGIDNPAYYRLTGPNNAYYWNGTGCGNEIRSDSEMGRRLILDSLKHWVNEYHIDGFRFDLATIIDKETMMAIHEELPRGIYLIAEPWAADWNRNQWGKNDFRGTRWAKWNDDYRNNVRAFVTGNTNRDNLMTVIAGTCYWWAAKPTESINYVECHDNATLMDAVGNDKRKARLAILTLLTSQGVPMLHEGQEFAKNKFGNDNSYDQDNKINHIDWTLKEANRDFYEFVKGLIAIRKKYPHFRRERPLTDSDIKWLLNGNNNQLGFILYGSPDIMVLLNGDPHHWVTYILPDNVDWKILCNGEKVSLTGELGTARGDYKVPPVTGVILAK